MLPILHLKLARRFYCRRVLSIALFFACAYFLVKHREFFEKNGYGVYLSTLKFNDECHVMPSTVKFVLNYKSYRSNQDESRGTYIEPTIRRIHNLLEKIRSKEDKYQALLASFGVFSMFNVTESLKAYTDESNVNEIKMLYERFIKLTPDNKAIHIDPEFVDYLKRLSNYLSDGLRDEKHNRFRVKCLHKPVLIVACDNKRFTSFKDTIRSFDTDWPHDRIVFYDLGITKSQEKMLKKICTRCTIVKFPFSSIDKMSPYDRTMEFKIYVPFVIQDALRQYGTIIYADTSVRFDDSSFKAVLVDNYLRGFAVNEMPGHSLSCYTRSGTFEWFNQSYYHYDNINMAKANLLVITDTFLTRLIMKAWLTCALDTSCFSAFPTKLSCSKPQPSDSNGTDQSAMVIILTHFFFQSKDVILNGDQLHAPAPYNMFTSMQADLVNTKQQSDSDTKNSLTDNG